MTAVDFIPLGLIALGVGVFIFSQQAGLMFCKLGKAIWKISTLGLTDMHWFYPEDKAPQSMRGMGIVLCVIGVILAICSTVSLIGPNPFAAMRQANGYLNKVYGDTHGGIDFSCTSSDKPNEEIINYQYGDRKGKLHASWDGNKYIFTEDQEQR